MEEHITLTKSQASEIFAQWWKDCLANRSLFEKVGDPDVDGKDSADTFFAYANKYQ